MEAKIEEIEVRKLGNQMLEYSNELGNEIQKLRNILENISVAWSGDDATKYVNVMQEKYIIGLENINKVIYEYGKYLEGIPNVYETLEQVYSEKHIDV